MNIDDTLHGISTPLQINVRDVSLQATGFFYQELAAEDPNKKGYYWREIKETWIVSNRHVFLPEIEGKESIPDLITFHMRKIVGNGLQWDTITLKHDDIKQRLKLDTDPSVDIAVLRIGDLITKRIRDKNNYMNWSAVSVDNLPNNCNIPVEVADDVIIIGYPIGFYDTYNLFPIVKSGIIASRWGMHFKNKPQFLIDAKLFPGSSGSIVLTKPTASIVADGPITGYRESHFAFLGVYSGEPYLQEEPIDLGDITITRKYGFNLGIVWYAELVVNVVNRGITLS
ncbi:MAG: trypsin-like peptidase domain-containing protein [Chloroflexi bacterium]|nr:trypsin-like peptidase domain-containing protein [Chloroflexota bacterium]